MFIKNNNYQFLSEKTDDLINDALKSSNIIDIKH